MSDSYPDSDETIKLLYDRHAKENTAFLRLIVLCIIFFPTLFFTLIGIFEVMNDEDGRTQNNNINNNQTHVYPRQTTNIVPDPNQPAEDTEHICRMAVLQASILWSATIVFIAVWHLYRTIRFLLLPEQNELDCLPKCQRYKLQKFQSSLTPIMSGDEATSSSADKGKLSDSQDSQDGHQINNEDLKMIDEESDLKCTSTFSKTTSVCINVVNAEIHQDLKCENSISISCSS